jgi:CHRD domain-containing protein
MHLKILAIPISFVFFFGIISNSAMPAYAEVSDCTATLNGSQEVPSVNTTGMGSADVTFDSDTNELSWMIEFSELSGPATAAHFHGPAAAGVNAGVQVNIGDVSGLTSPMNGSAVLTSSQATSLLDGDMYINIHTAANPNGEIRGQVMCEEETPTDGEWETATVTIGGDEFDIQYMISGGTLDELTANSDTKTLMATISSTSNGTLTIQLPNDVINAEEDFSVFIDDETGNSVVDEDDPESDPRVLQIEFDQGAEVIEIVGTSIAGGEQPEQWETATLTIGDDEFDIQYMITNGTLDTLTGDNETSTITAMITANDTGTLMIKLPRDIVDAVGSNGTDSDYVVMVDGVDESVDDDFGQDVRTLTIPFPADSEKIDITGTFIVPEFSAITAILLSVAIVGVVIAATRYGKFSLPSRS